MSNKFDYIVDAYKVYSNHFDTDNLPEPAKNWADPHLVRPNRTTGKFEDIICEVKSCTDTKLLGVPRNTICYLVFDYKDTDEVEYVIYYRIGLDCYDFEVYDKNGFLLSEETESYVKKFWPQGDIICKHITFKNPESKIVAKYLCDDILTLYYRDGSNKTIFFEDENN